MTEAKNNFRKMPLKTRYAVFLGLGLAIAVAVGFILLSSYTGSTEPIKKLASQLKTDPNWELVGEKIEPPRLSEYVCYAGNRCPSLHREWRLGEDMTRPQFEKMLQTSGWELDIRGDCNPSFHVIGESFVCSAQGTVENYDVEVWLRKNKNKENSTKLILSIN